jgi:CHAT domain-containing protein
MEDMARSFKELPPPLLCDEGRACPVFRHSRESGNLYCQNGLFLRFWIPAFAGMTRTPVGILRRLSVVTGAALAMVLTVSASPLLAAEEQPPGIVNLANETCQTEPRNDIAPDPGSPLPMTIRCGKATRSSGAVTLSPLPLELPKTVDERHATLVKIAALSPAGRDGATRMACRDGLWQETDDKIEVFLRHCSLVDGDWPYVSGIAVIGQYLVQFEGLPSNLPVLQTVAAQMAEYISPDGAFGDPAKAHALAETIFDGKAILVGSDDLDRFSQFAESARLNNSRKDYRAAEDAYRQALLIQERAQGTDSPGIGSTLMELALEVSNQNRSDEAAALFRRADPIIQRSPNPAAQARYFSYLAFDAANAGRYPDGLAYAREATSIWRDLSESKETNLEDLSGDGSGNDSRSMMRGELAHSLNTQAALALHVGDLSEAEASAKEALAIVGDESGLPPWWKPEILSTIGRVYAALGQFNQAEASFRGALIYQQRLFGDTAPTAATLLALSGVYAEENLYDDSLRAYDFAMKILAADDLARSQVVFDQMAPVLISATALAESSPQRRDELNEKMIKSLQLLSTGVADQTIAQASARLATSDPAIEKLVSGLQDAERKRDAARIELAHETSLPDEQRGASKETALLAELNRQTVLHDGLEQQIAKEFPAYSGLIHPQPVPLATLQSHLQPREALVLFEIGRAKAFAVVITAKQVTARPLEIDQTKVEETVVGLRKAFDLPGGRLGEFDLEQSFGLYRSLFGPVEKSLDDIDRLVVVPSGALASLPMSLLITRKPAGAGDYRHASWLARRFATAEAPSIGAFVSLRERAETKARASQPFLGVGNPNFVGEVEADKDAKSGLAALSSQCRDSGPIPAHFLRALAPLPDTATELRTVARSLGATDDSLLLGAGATEEALRQRPLEDVRILYFATHALLPGELSCQSEPAIALSPPLQPATSKDTDGLLDASEIAGLRLNADLVVLSACNTAEAKSKFGGEALSGLAESFFYAGARSVIASHWHVPSTATANLMVGMMQRLTSAPSGGTAEALRQSQLVLMDRDETAHPFFWAAFTVIGDGGQLSPAVADATSDKRL